MGAVGTNVMLASRWVGVELAMPGSVIRCASHQHTSFEPVKLHTHSQKSWNIITCPQPDLLRRIGVKAWRLEYGFDLLHFVN